MTKRIRCSTAVAVFAILATACSGSVVVDDALAPDDPVVSATATPAPAASPTPEPSPTPTPTPRPTPEPLPTPEPTPDPTPVVFRGDGWTLTEAEIDRLADYIEEVHELEFTARVAVVSDDDIGAGFAEGLESFSEDDWRLLQLLDLIDEGVERDAVNEARRVRIRGVCCRLQDQQLTVIVEPRSTKLETEAIVVHELVHALHRQHEDLVGRPAPSAGFEIPAPESAVFEAIAQFVTFRYLEEQPIEDQQAIADELPVVDAALAEVAGRVPSAMLDFAYFTAPRLADEVYEAKGAEGLSELLGRPPTTTEQLLHPEAWLDNEDRVSQDRPELPAGARLTGEGRIGVALLGWVLETVTDEIEIDQLLDQWTGDRWAEYRHDGQTCLAATIEMDDADSAVRSAALLEARYGVELDADESNRVRFERCL